MTPALTPPHDELARARALAEFRDRIDAIIKAAFAPAPRRQDAR